MNKKIISRLAVFFIGVPLVIFIIWLQAFNHLAMQLLIITFSFGGAVELYNILKLKGELLPKPLVVILSGFIPVITALHSILPSIFDIHFSIGQEISTCALILAVLLCLAVEVFGAKEFEASLHRITGSVFIILYTGYLFTFIQRMSAFTVNGINVCTQFICMFIIMVFMCDSMAWFFGVLFGKNNKGFVKASPNKSIAGFIGGFAGSVGGGIACYYIWPEVFTGSIVKVIVLGLIMAFSAVVGDLAESVFKRSAGVKDSGKIIPGRGGILDSIDSIVMSAPVFYLMTTLLYNPF